MFFRANPAHLKAFEELFSVTFVPNDDPFLDSWIHHVPGFNEQSLWNRMKLHIGTCSNYAERFRRTLKTHVDIIDTLEKKVLNLQTQIIEKFVLLTTPRHSRDGLREFIRNTQKVFLKMVIKLNALNTTKTAQSVLG
jgi:hypothetical protein